MNGTNYEDSHCGAFFIPILIPLGPKFSPHDPVFKSPYLDSFLNVRDHVSQPYSTTANIIVLYISIQILRKKQSSKFKTLRKHTFIEAYASDMERRNWTVSVFSKT